MSILEGDKWVTIEAEDTGEKRRIKVKVNRCFVGEIKNEGYTCLVDVEPIGDWPKWFEALSEYDTGEAWTSILCNVSVERISNFK